MTSNPNAFEHNPFAAPETMAYAMDGANRPAALIRQQYLSHEASVQSVGMLYMLGCILTLLGGGIMTYGSLSGEFGADPRAGMGLLFIGLGIAQGFLGFGLSRLKRWTRIPVALFAVLGLLAFPLGTLINGYILYLLLGSKGKMVFSAEYREVIRQTPEMKYKTSAIVWVCLLLLLGVLALGVGAAIFRL